MKAERRRRRRGWGRKEKKKEEKYDPAVLSRQNKEYWMDFRKNVSAAIVAQFSSESLTLWQLCAGRWEINLHLMKMTFPFRLLLF